MRRTYLNPSWFDAYSTNKHQITIISDQVKRELEEATRRAENLGEEGTLHDLEIPRVEVELPQHSELTHRNTRPDPGSRGKLTALETTPCR